MTNLSVYPNKIDSTSSLPLATNLVTAVAANSVNALNNAIINIEQELGLNPAGIYASVRARLDAITQMIGTGGGGSGFISIANGASVIQSQATALKFTGAATVSVGSPHEAIINVGGTSVHIEDRFAPANNQTLFTLSQIPAVGSSVSLFINGLKQEFNTDFTLSGQNITYLGTPLITTDKVDVNYFTTLSIGANNSMIVQNNSTTIDNASTTLNFLSGVVTTPSTGVVDINLPSTKHIQETKTVTNGQTSFTLLQTPFDSGSVSMFLNGLRQEFGIDYTVSGTTVTWLGTTLVNTDEVDFTYFSSLFVAAQNSMVVQNNSITIDTSSTTLNFLSGTVTSPSTGIVNINLPTTKYIQETKSVSNGQTSFTLLQVPFDPTSVSMFFNGLKQEYSIDYTVSGTTVNWLGTSLITTDKIDFAYFSSLYIAGQNSMIIQSETVPIDAAAGTLNFTGGVLITSISTGMVKVRLPIFTQEAPSVANSQTSFNLTQLPFASNTVSMYVNGIRQIFNTDYTVSGSVITYSGVALFNTDTVSFTYHY